ncbi:hypothetical protein LINPERHAP1_LOCUS19718 [Linum perenne]
MHVDENPIVDQLAVHVSPLHRLLKQGIFVYLFII